MLKTNNNQNTRNLQFGDYKFRHEKNAFVVGDRVLMYENKEGKASKVWRTVVSIDSENEKLYFEDSGKKGGVSFDNSNIYTTDAWDRAFENCITWKEDKEKKGYVVSYEIFNGLLCVVITNKMPKIHTKWYYGHEDGHFIKKEDTNVQGNVLWVCRKDTNMVISVSNNGKARIGVDDAIIDPAWDWFEQKAKGRPVVWNGEKAKEICEKCPWLLTEIVLWKYEDEELEVQGRPFIDFWLDKKSPVIKNGEGELKLLTTSEVEEKDMIINLRWLKNSKDWKHFALRAKYVRRFCKVCPWLLNVESVWYIEELKRAWRTTGRKILDWLDGKIKVEEL